MTLILDAGALLALERGDREVYALLKHELAADRAPSTHGGVVAQVWRGRGSRQAILARHLHAVDVWPLDKALGRQAGALLGKTGTADPIDAAVVAMAVDGDVILTSDPDDLERLAHAHGAHVELVAV